MKKVIAKSTPKNQKKQTKASVNKASLQKLSNKKNNRLAKQGKLNKKDKDKKKKKARLEELSKKAQAIHDREELPESEVLAYDSEPEDNDEDIEYFKHLANARKFSSASLDSSVKEPRAKKRKKAADSEDEGEDYEQEARTFTEDKAKDMKMMLPIINKGKVINRMVKQDQADLPSTDSPFFNNEKDEDQEDDSETEQNGEEEKKPPTADEERTKREYLATLNTAQKFAYCKNKLAEHKHKIAVLSQGLLEDPINNIRKLKELRLLLGSHEPGVALSVRKYALVSMAEVFKDIVPGYRLRVPTEKERSNKVKKETKALWDYEASFLLNYKIYLEFLELMAKDRPIADKTFLSKHKITHLKLPKAAARELGRLSLHCLCEMLTSHTHFNYRDNIIVSIVPFANHKHPEFVKIACDAIKNVFRTDKAGDIILEVVRAIGRMVKKKDFDVEPPVLQTFLTLKIKEVDLSGTVAKTEKILRKEKMMKYSRRERKRLKAKEALDRELLETKASADKARKLKLHTETIQAVFETYIRVIKLAPDSALLPAVLEGLAKFAHLINIEYFDALFSALNGLIESGNLTTRESLHCMQTAFTILSGQGSVINIDPTNFYRHFYNNMVPVAADDQSETVTVVLQCLDAMINKRRKQVSQQRVLAFMKRLMTLSLQQNPEGAVAFLAQARHMVHMYKYTDVLYDSEVQGSGVYLPYLEDPEHCCANSTQLWELHLLRHHFCPSVQRYCRHLIHQAPLAGQGQLPQELARKSPNEIYEQLKKRESFHSLPVKSTRKRRRRNNLSPGFLAYLQSVSPEAATVIEEEMSEVTKGSGGTEAMDMS